MRKFISVFFLSVFVVSAISYSFASSTIASKNIESAEYVRGEVLVKFKATKINLKTSAGQRGMQNFAVSQHMEMLDDMSNNNMAVMKISGNETVEQKIDQLKSDLNIEYSEPNYIYRSQSFNDTYSGNLRGLSQISGYQAFAVFSGNSDQSITGTIVAVIDAGVAYDHPDLVNQMWDGSSCKNENGGVLGSCIYGYDFVDGDKNPYPVRSNHGTHVAGIIAAQADNAKGVIGMNYNAKIMAVRVGDSTMTLGHIINGIDFARQNGAKIINASLGGAGYSSGMYDAINAFRSGGGLFVVAAGNDGANNDTGTHIYPCDYSLDNIICVAATDSSDLIASFSNYGTSSVDVGAPGVTIYSTLVTIVTTTGLLETFESTATGSLATGWTQSGTLVNWGVLDSGVPGWDNTLYSDMDTPYANNANSTVQKSVATNGASGVTIDFWAACDTQYVTSSRADYMTVEASSDGSTFVEIDRIDEAYLDDDQVEGNNTNGVTSANLTYDLTGYYSSANFVLRFRRVTDSSDNNYNGCLVDDVAIRTNSANTTAEPYGNMNGTSMATPYVAGLASLVRSMRPDVGYQTIRSVIIGSGDIVASLSGKTVSGKRINAYSTLSAIRIVGSPNNISVTVLSGTSVNVAFTTDIVATGYVVYGTSSLDMSANSGNATSHSIRLNGLVEGTTYSYRVYGLNNSYTGTYSATGTFTTPEATTVSTGATVTGNAFLVGYTSTGYTSLAVGTLQINSGSSFISVSLSGLSLSASGGTWDGILTPPVVSSNPTLGVGGLPASSTNNGSTTTTRTILLTTQAGSVTDSLAVSGGGNFTISFVVSAGTSGDTLNIKRSEDNSTWGANEPDPTCQLNSGFVCRFDTNHLSYFTTIKETTSNNPSGGGGGGGGGGGAIEPIRDVCLSGDKSGNSSDGTCDAKVIILTGVTTSGNNLTTNSLYTGELLELFGAYTYAKEIGITTMPTMQEANLTGHLIRSHMAKMMVNYAIHVLGKTPDTSKKCIFTDTSKQSAELKLYIKYACQLGLMGVGNPRFNPEGEVTRSEFGTVLSRALFGNLFESGSPYYKKHLAGLKLKGIISNITPTLKEQRGYVMLMLMRAKE